MNLISKEFGSFIIAGMINTFIGYSIFVVLFWIIGNKEITVSIGTIIGLFFSYNVHKKLVFHKSTKRYFKNYIIVHFSGFLINLMSLWILVDIYELNVYLAQLIIVGYLTVIKFFLNKKYVFLAYEKESK